MDDMLTMDPPPALRMAGIAAFVPRNTPLELTSMTRSHCSSVVSSKGDVARAALHRNADAGVVDQRVQLTVAFLGQSDDGLPVGFAGNVQVGVGHFVTLGPLVGLHLPAQVIENVSEYDPRALAGEQADLLGAHAASAAANQNYLAINTAHDVVLLFCR